MPTWTIYSSNTNGAITCQSSTYATARSGGGSLSGTATGSQLVIVGDMFNTPTYSLREGLFHFDTSFLSGISAVGSLVFRPQSGGGSTTTWEFRSYNWPTGTSSDWIPGANLSSYTLIASILNSAITTDTDATLTDVNLLGGMQNATDGSTKLVLTSDNLRTGTAPVADSSRYFIGQEASGRPFRAVLTVTATLPDVVDFGASNNAGGSTTLPFTLAVSPQAGDTLVLAVTARGTTNTASLAGFTEIDSASLSRSDGSNAKTTWLYKICSGSEGTSIAPAITSAKASGSFWLIRGANASAPMSTNLSQAGSSTTPTAPTITPAIPYSIQLWYAGMGNNDVTTTVPTGFTDSGRSSSTGAGAASRTTSQGAHRIYTNAIRTSSIETQATGTIAGSGAWGGTGTWTSGQLIIKLQSFTAPIASRPPIIQGTYAAIHRASRW